MARFFHSPSLYLICSSASCSARLQNPVFSLTAHSSTYLPALGFTSLNSSLAMSCCSSPISCSMHPSSCQSSKQLQESALICVCILATRNDWFRSNNMLNKAQKLATTLKKTPCGASFVAPHHMLAHRNASENCTR